MAVRTVRLNRELEAMVREIVERTGMRISEALRQGILLLRRELAESPERLPYEIFARLDLGPGGYSAAPSTQSRRGVREALRRKHGR